jgi:hypothetical protein
MSSAFCAWLRFSSAACRTLRARWAVDRVPSFEADLVLEGDPVLGDLVAEGLGLGHLARRAPAVEHGHAQHETRAPPLEVVVEEVGGLADAPAEAARELQARAHVGLGDAHREAPDALLQVHLLHFRSVGPGRGHRLLGRHVHVQVAQVVGGLDGLADGAHQHRVQATSAQLRPALLAQELGASVLEVDLETESVELGGHPGGAAVPGGLELDLLLSHRRLRHPHPLDAEHVVVVGLRPERHRLAPRRISSWPGWMARREP